MKILARQTQMLMALGAAGWADALTIRRRSSVLLLLLLLLSPGTAWSIPVKVPLQLDYSLVRHLLMAQVYSGPGDRAEVWNDGGCNSLVLANPRVSPDNGRIRIVSDASAEVGNLQGEYCVRILEWQGGIELVEEPTVAPGRSVVQFTIVDSGFSNQQGQNPMVTGTLWAWMKEHVHPRLEPLRLDLESPLREIRELMPLSFPLASAETVRDLLDSLTIAEVRAADKGLVVTLQFDIPEMVGQPPLAAQPALTPEEAEKWEEAWQGWDAFLTFVIKEAARETELRALRQALLTVLLDARHDLSEALVTWTPGTPDPVRLLFLKSWKRLAPVLRELSATLPGAEAGRYLSFIAGADALEALDRAGEQMGFQLSADGLRLLARTIAPDQPEDPSYNLDVDPELRQLLEYGPPLPLPEPIREEPITEERITGLGLGSWLSLSKAWAADRPDSSVVKKLDHWVPQREEIGTYLPLVRNLLERSAAAAVSGAGLDQEFHEIFRRTSLATAWQESCWRQFIKTGGKVQTLVSNAQSVGIMQINVRVWRGFYDATALQQDIVYNARAGNEILLHYFKDYAIAEGEHKKTSDANNLARASYAAYNGGPGHLDRYRRNGVSKNLAEIDRVFWEKYQAIIENELGVAKCWNVDLRSSALSPASPCRDESGTPLTAECRS
ncbi:MAG: lytic transglycosylase domain-containing protein [Desulfobacteraceae bacterium]|nr:MAG: lytic transglycosylase domain-containing protein [Desulfobacteraceae bacterium]